MPPRPHRSVERIIRVLEEVASSTHGRSLAELSRVLGAPKSTLQGFANGLVEAGYLDEQNKRYFPGPGIFMLANRSHRIPSQMVRHDDLVELQEATECSVLLGVLAGQNLLYVDMVLRGRRQEYFLMESPRRPTLRTAGGKLLVALKPYDEMRNFLEREDPALVRDFLGEVDSIVAEQRCVVPSSIQPGISAIAAPLRTRAGDVVAALVLTSHSESVLSRVEELHTEMVTALKRWSHRGSAL